MNEDLIYAIKQMGTEDSPALSGFDVTDIHDDWSLEHDRRVLYTTGFAPAANKRQEIKHLLLYINETTGYLIEVMKMGPGYPKSAIKIPEGFETPERFQAQERATWFALIGEFQRVSPNDYVLANSPEKTLAQSFHGKRADHAYVHMA